MELLALMVILSSANGNHWHQFPLPYVNYYHIPTVFSRSFSITPLASNTGYSVLPKTFQNSPVNNFNTNTGHTYSTENQGPSFVTSEDTIPPQGMVPSNKFTSGNIVEQAEAQAGSALEILKSFKGSNIAAQYIEPIFATNECLNNLEDVIKLIEEGTNLIVANKPEIIYLEAIVDHLQDEKDIGKIIKASSKMLRVLDSLIPDLSSQTTKLCISTPEASVKAFKDIANVLELISDNRNFNVPSNSKQILTFASKVMVQTADFLESLNESLERFENLCKTDDKDHSLVFSSIVDIMESLAELFEAMGFEDKSSNILEQTTFIKKIVVSFRSIIIIQLTNMFRVLLITWKILIHQLNAPLVVHTMVWHRSWMISAKLLKMLGLKNFPRSSELT